MHKGAIIRLLRWSERYTKTDMVYLAHGGAWLFLTQGTLFILSFLLLWVFANFLSKELYGEYRFLMTVVGILTLFTLPGMRTALVRAVARGHSGVMRHIIITRLTWGALGSFAALFGAGYYAYMDNWYLAGLFALAAVFIPIHDTYDLIGVYHNGRKDYPRYAATTIVRRLVVVISTIATIFLTSNLYLIIGVYLASTTITNIIVYYYTLHIFPLSSTGDTETITYGKHLSVMSSMQYLSTHLDKVVLWYLAGPVQVAIYTIAVALPREITTALQQVGILALPKMAHREKVELQQSLVHKLVIMFLGCVPVALLYYLLSPLLFTFLLPQYLESIIFSQYTSLIILFAPLVLLNQYFVATVNTRALYTMQFVQPTITIGLFFILIPIYGVAGAIFALIGKEITSAIIYMIFFIGDTYQSGSTSTNL